MNEWNGIPINEGRLLVLTVIFTVAAIGLVVLGAFWLRSAIEDFFPDRSNRRRIEAIQARGEDDPKVQKQLKKLARREKKRRKARRMAIIEDVLIGLLLSGMLLVDLFWCVIPGWSDYLTKDYMVYTGAFEVESYTKNHYIILEDGTRLSGSAGLAEGEHRGQVVYAARSEIVLGAKE